MDFVSQVESNGIYEAIIDGHLYLAMPEDLNQFERNKMCELDPKAYVSQVIGT